MEGEQACYAILEILSAVVEAPVVTRSRQGQQSHIRLRVLMKIMVDASAPQDTVVSSVRLLQLQVGQFEFTSLVFFFFLFSLHSSHC